VFGGAWGSLADSLLTWGDLVCLSICENTVWAVSLKQPGLKSGYWARKILVEEFETKGYTTYKELIGKMKQIGYRSPYETVRRLVIKGHAIPVGRKPKTKLIPSINQYIAWKIREKTLEKNLWLQTPPWVKQLENTYPNIGKHIAEYKRKTRKLQHTMGH